MVKAKTVAVIGAGSSGIVAAKVLIEDGFDVTLFDREKQIGGIWSPDGAYIDLQAQLVAGFMEFSDLTDKEGHDYARWQHLHNYLQNYSDKFHVTERIRFQTEVVLIDKYDLKNPDIPWIVKIKTIDGQYEILEYDFVVVATGLFSTPYVPTFRGQNKFAGKIVHACSIKKEEQLANKRIIIIGGGKSAVDLAAIAATYANSCYMIFRRSHWFVPRDLLKGYLPIGYIFSRIFTLTCYPYPLAPHGSLYHYIHGSFSFIANKIFDSMSADVMKIYGPDLYEDKRFVPKCSFQNSENFVRVTEKFLKMKREGRIIRKLAWIDEIIDETTVRLDSGEIIQADLIICATGFIEQVPFLCEPLGRIVGQETTKPTSHDGIDLNLYRRIIPVGVPNISFIGFVAVARQWIYSEAQSHWTSDYFLGRLKLPKTEKEMYEEIEIIRNFIRKLFNRKTYYMQYYWLEPVEIYLQDMGVELHRTNNWFTEYFGIYKADRIKDLHKERQALANGKPLKHWYFGVRHTILLVLVILFFFFFFFF